MNIGYISLFFIIVYKLYDKAWQWLTMKQTFKLQAISILVSLRPGNKNNSLPHVYCIVGWVKFSEGKKTVCGTVVAKYVEDSKLTNF